MAAIPTANLVADLDPAHAYADAGLTAPATTDGASVLGLAAQSGTTHNATGTIAATLKLGANGIGGLPALAWAGNATLSTDAFITSAYDKAISIYIVTSFPTTTNNLGVSVSISNANCYLGQTSQFGADVDLSSPPISRRVYCVQSPASQPQISKVVGMTYDGTTARQWVNLTHLDTAATANTGLTGAVTLGNLAAGGFPFMGLTGRLLVYNVGHDQTTAASIIGQLQSQYSITIPSNKRVLVFGGNSWVAGVGATDGSTDIGADVINSLGDGWLLAKDAQGGRTIDNMAIEAPALTDPYFSIPATDNVYVGWELVNQLGNGGETAADCYAKYKSLFTGRRAAGARHLVAIDCLPNTGVESLREAVNVLIAGDFPTQIGNHVYAAGPGVTWADYLVRVSEDPVMGQSGQNANAAWYSGDNVHPNPAGYARLATYVTSALMVVTASGRVVTTSTGVFAT